MRIYALEVLFVVGVLNAPAVGAEAVPRENTSLPQFMPPEARAGIADAKRTRNDTRRAAEALSAKFSDDQPPSRDVAAADREKFEPVSPEAVDLETNAASSAHVAVLRARSPARRTGPKTPKSVRSKVAVNGPNAQTTTSPSRRRPKRPDFDPGPSSTSSEKEVPGAKVGWQTGVIGMLTNPAFWH